MNLLNPRRTELSGVPFLNNALDWLLSRINAIWQVEHDGEGHHTDITADSLTLAFDDVTQTGGTITAGGAGTFDGNVTADADGTPVVTGALGDVTGLAYTEPGVSIKASSTNWWTVAAETGTFSSSPSLIIRDHPNANATGVVMAVVRRSAINALPAEYALEPSTSSTPRLYLGRDVLNARWYEVNASTIRANTAYYEQGRSTAIGAWTAYTPVWTGQTTNPTLGNGTLVGRYTLINDTCHFQIKLTIGATTTLATGYWIFTVPATSEATWTIQAIGHALCENVGVTDYGGGTAWLLNTTTCIVSFDSGNYVTETNPFAWASGDILTISGTYEIA